MTESTIIIIVVIIIIIVINIIRVSYWRSGLHTLHLKAILPSFLNPSPSVLPLPFSSFTFKTPIHSVLLIRW